MQKYFWIVVLFLLLYSCKTNKRSKIIPFNKMNKESIIKIPFEFKKDELANLIDSLLPDTLLEKEEGLPLSIKILKSDISGINLDGKNIDLVVSIKVDLVKKIGSFPVASGSGEIELDIFSQIDIDKNWKLKTKTTLVDYSWVNKPVISFIGMKISAPKLVEEYIDYKQMEWMNQVDSTIANSNLLQSPVDSIAGFFSSPIVIDSLGIAGLKISPKTIGFSPFKSSQNTISGQLNLSFFNDIIPMSEYRSNDTIYPKFNWYFNEDFGQKAVLTLGINKYITQKLIDDYLLAQDSKGLVFDIKGNEIKIEKANVVFDKDVVGAKVDFSGSKSGNILVKTRPIWDRNQKYLFLKKRFVDINLDGFGSQIFVNLFSNTLERKIMDGLQESLNLKIKDIVDDTNQFLDTLKYDNTLTIKDYNLPMQLEDGYFFIDVDFALEGKITWNKLNIELK